MEILRAINELDHNIMAIVRQTTGTYCRYWFLNLNSYKHFESWQQNVKIVDCQPIIFCQIKTTVAYSSSTDSPKKPGDYDF